MSKAISLALMYLSALPLAAQEHADHAAPPPAAQPAAPSQQGSPTHDMRAHMQAMHEQMERIHAAQDPEERQRLMSEHMQSMQESMGMMGRMGQSAPAESPRGQSQCAQGDMPCRMQEMQTQHGMMQERMSTMHQLMEQMVEHMRAAEGSRSGGRRR